LEFELNDPDLWKNREMADLKIKELGELNELVKKFEEIEKELNNLEMKYSDKFVDSDAFVVLDRVQNKLRQLEREQLFTGKYDKQSAILSIYAGAGGQDAEDWAGMLFEMYLKFCEKRGWKVKVINESLGDFQSKTGRRLLKDITLEIKGNYVYGYLKKESGVHRLVRISPFSPEKKRHTSFALVEVLPDISDSRGLDADLHRIEIPEKDLKIEFFRSSGPGGQNVNKVETAVRIVHLPTGITATSQVERSQAQNRERAMNLLQAKLLKLMEDSQIKELDKLRVKVKPEWGNQIRSYVLHPYKLVKDHRTGIETTQAEKVLDGELDLFVESDII
jgi:peptide chain release factor 2